MSAPPEYLTPEDIGGDAVAEGVARHFEEVRDGRARRLDRTYYDTFDGLLHRAGLTLASDGGALELAERGTGTVRARETAGPARFAFELAPGPLRDALTPVVEVRALLPLVRVRMHKRGLDLL